MSVIFGSQPYAEKMDSPARVKWLREQIAGYTRDLSARSYFRLPCFVLGFTEFFEPVEIPDPKAECRQLARNLAEQNGLSQAEAESAFDAEWAESMRICEQQGEKLRMIALGHIKVAGCSAGLADTFMTAAKRFPDNWPFLTQDNFEAIAAGFSRRAVRRRG